MTDQVVTRRQTYILRVLAIVLLSVRPSVRPSFRLSVCLGVRHISIPIKAQLKDSGFSPYDSVESIAFCDQISCCWARRFPSNEGIKEGFPLCFTAIGSSSVRTVADRHRLAAYHNKRCWRAFRGTDIDDLEQPWTFRI